MNKKLIRSVLIVNGLLWAGAAAANTPTPVFLGRARPFAILSETGITDIPSSAIVGAIGTTPITGAADHVSCSEVTGKVFSVDAAGPAPCSIAAPTRLADALGDMKIAYKNATGRRPTVTELGAGNIGGRILAPGVYYWSSGVQIPTSIMLKGGSTDVWIFQIAQDLSIASAQSVLLSPGARPANIFWQVAGKVTLATGSHFSGTILCKTLIAMKTGATINGHLFAQTAVTLQQNAVTKSGT